MTLNLRNALPREQEPEATQLDDFEFRLRGRRIRLLAEWLRARLPGIAGIDPALIASRIAEHDDHHLVSSLADLATRAGVARSEVMTAFERCATEARRQLVAERDEPTPHRLA